MGTCDLMLKTQNLKAVFPRGKSHMCISCANLLGVSRRIKKNPEGRHIGHTYKCRCEKNKHARHPWIALPCRFFEEDKSQTRLIDYPVLKKKEN